MFFRPFPAVLGLLVTAFFSFGATAGHAHEFWIEPTEFQVKSGAPLLVNLRNGQNFSGSKLPYFPKRFQRFDLIMAGQTAPAKGRMGDVPAFQTTAPEDGLLIIVHQTAPKTLKYGKWEKFAKFADHKGFSDIRARHEARGLPEKGFTEVYTRYAKALIGVEDAQGADASTGMETEFVALTNPYSDDLSQGMKVLVLYQDEPRANTQIEVFERNQDGIVAITYLQTDANGRAAIPVLAGHTYLLDAVVLRDAPAERDAVWETLWAALTFAVPG